MADFPTTDSAAENSAWAYVDLAALEDRLNRLGGDVDSASLNSLEDSLLDRFLANENQAQAATRTVSSNGAITTETAVHYNRVNFQAGQTRAVIHLAFEPDLIDVPMVDANLIDGEGRARVTHVKKFGVRIELQLSHTPTENSTICLESICTATYRE